MLSHMKCKSCGKVFDYSFIPGGSLTSVRLGRARYFRCPHCRRFQTFSLRDRIKKRHEGELFVDDVRPTALFLAAITVLVILILALVFFVKL